MIPLSAKGMGTTLHCKQDLTLIDLGPQLTNNPFERTIVLENKGRRHQALRWSNKTNVQANHDRLTKKGPASRKPIEPIFTIFPLEITLRPRTATTITITGTCREPGTYRETFLLESKVGKETKFRPVLESTTVAQVVNPFLEISPREMSFEYVWEDGVDATVQKKKIMLTNVSALHLHFTLKTEAPFNLSDYEYSLAPGDIGEVIVEFDPLYCDDKCTHVVDKTIEIVYRRHPHREHVKLTGDIAFPNISFETMDVNFGCILNDTTKRVQIRLHNPTKVPSIFEWVWDAPVEPMVKAGTLKRRTSSKDMPLLPAQVFDILPVRGCFSPGPPSTSSSP